LIKSPLCFLHEYCFIDPMRKSNPLTAEVYDKLWTDCFGITFPPYASTKITKRNYLLGGYYHCDLVQEQTGRKHTFFNKQERRARVLEDQERGLGDEYLNDVSSEHMKGLKLKGAPATREEEDYFLDSVWRAKSMDDVRSWVTTGKNERERLKLVLDKRWAPEDFMTRDFMA